VGNFYEGKFKGDIRDESSDIEDLAFPSRSLRESYRVGRRVCLSEASYAAAEKSGEGMA